MEPSASVCLICFEITENYIFVPSDAPPNLLSNCNKYLHSTITQETLKHIQLNRENQLVICKNCFDFALELTQLSEQLTNLQKNIADLTVAFSMAVFHRRSQVYSASQMQNNCQSFNSSSIIEFNEACLPPNLFSNKNQNINLNKNDHDININNLKLNTPTTDITNEKLYDFQFNNVSAPDQPLIANDDTEVQTEFNEVNDQHLIQPTIERNRNLATASEMIVVDAADGNNSKNPKDLNVGIQLTISDVISEPDKISEKSLEKINTKAQDVEAAVENSCQTNSESHQNVTNQNQTQFKNVEFSDPSCAPNCSNDSQGEKMLKCFYCEKTFTEAGDRNIHHRTHFGDKPFKSYKCSYCTKRFHAQLNCRAHERTHKEEIPHKCSYCERYFSSIGSKKTHELIHTGGNPYKCSFCDKIFPYLRDRKPHEMTHITNKFLKCSFCEKRFSLPILLKAHEMTHTGDFKCSFCEKTFSVKDAKRVHERTHTGEKQFKCSVCEKKFYVLGALKRHENTHIGEMIYKCLYCEQTFKQLCHRNNHQNTHLEKQPSTITPLQLSNPTGDSLPQLDQHEIMNSTTLSNFKCSFCEVTFSQDVDRIIHERIHRKIDGSPIKTEETVNEDCIVGI